ncbi:trypsin-like peptidase domain-containing protein [Streptomyces subrutilus]|uniref:trypsin-like peptidase domain-containing protein n=1 Tax=Streptomyces subrutilus TaxID=36818 RepID=UPI002E13615B|nr:trypsin-like peptidase domain-containing protein [Streptomyces subrutilus]
MRRTLVLAAAAAALLVPGGPLPVAEAGPAAPVGAGRWSAREAEAFWTAERMASAAPLPDPEPAAVPGPAAPPVPVAPSAPGRPGTADPGPSADPAPAAVPAVDPAAVPAPDPVADPSGTAAPQPSGASTAPAAPVEVPPSDPASPRPVAPLLPAAADPGVGQDFDGLPVVGRMYVMKAGGAYFCTASVVASPGRDLVLSAAHCLLGPDSRQVAFVPRYTRANPRPYGMFPVLRDGDGDPRIWIDPRYRSQGPDRAATLDVAFAQVGPNVRGVPVQDVVGGNRLLTGAAYAQRDVTLIGHPASASRPRLCVNRTTKFTSSDARIPGSFLRIDCTGYPGGTSGGPFLLRLNSRTGTGDVVGVIGGWKTGGDTADTSYSSYFGADVRKLYDRAVAETKTG